MLHQSEQSIAQNIGGDQAHRIVRSLPTQRRGSDFFAKKAASSGKSFAAESKSKAGFRFCRRLDAVFLPDRRLPDVSA
jgi:hypothetical protein